MMDDQKERKISPELSVDQCSNDEQIKSKALEEQLEFIERWKIEMIEWIHRQTNEVKEKISDVYQRFYSEWKERHRIVEIELRNKRDSNELLEQDLTDLFKQIDRLEEELAHQDQVLHQITINELNKIIPKYQPLTTISKKDN